MVDKRLTDKELNVIQAELILRAEDGREIDVWTIHKTIEALKELRERREESRETRESSNLKNNFNLI